MSLLFLSSPCWRIFTTPQKTTSLFSASSGRPKTGNAKVPIMTESRPNTKRSISFAKVGWKQPSGQLSVPAPARLSPLHPKRPAAAGRSVSFAHARRPSTSRRPGFAPRSLSFCDTRWTPSGRNLSLREDSVSGPFAFLNPTTAIFDIWTDDGNELADVTNPERGQKARVRWNARDFRKGISLHTHPRGACYFDIDN